MSMGLRAAERAVALAAPQRDLFLAQHHRGRASRRDDDTVDTSGFVTTPTTFNTQPTSIRYALVMQNMKVASIKPLLEDLRMLMMTSSWFWRIKGQNSMA
jgi:hypothetical protein